MKTLINEDTRNQLISKSRNADIYKNQSFGKNRFERKRFSKVASLTKSFNNIDMNKLFKQDILEIAISVIGETDNYEVTVQFFGVIAELAKNIKSNNNIFEFKTILQALVKVFNTSEVKIKCTCKDFCLHKDTEIKLLDGRVLTVEELSKEIIKNKNLYVYSVDENGDFKPGKIKDVWQSGVSNTMIKVVLDNGNEILTTPDHPYMLRTGEYLPASELCVGQSLMPLYFSATNNGYETIKLNSKSGTQFFSTYKIVANDLLQEEIEEAKRRNHKITHIELIEYKNSIPVYDIEVEHYHNFYVNAGVILHNCYRYQHQLIINNNNVDGSESDPGPGKTGMANTQGKGCKHTLLVLNNMNWIIKIASVIKNYILYLDKNNHKLFINIIFPKLYGVSPDEAIDKNIVPSEVDLETDKNTIDIINDYAKNKGKIQKGTNKNPAIGTGKIDLNSVKSETQLS